MGQFHSARFHAIGAGKCSLLVSEKFALQESAGNGWTVNLNVGSCAPRRTAVNHSGDNVFTGATLAFDQDGDVGIRNLFQPPPQRLHDVRVAKNYESGGISPRDWTKELTAFGERAMCRL